MAALRLLQGGGDFKLSHSTGKGSPTVILSYSISSLDGLWGLLLGLWGGVWGGAMSQSSSSGAEMVRVYVVVEVGEDVSQNSQLDLWIRQ